MGKKIKVLIVDDSSIIRTLLSTLINADPEMEVVGTAPDPYIAREKLIKSKPDVITLDVEMPRMDGITFLEKVMKHFPTPTVIISSLTQKGTGTALRALESGAITIIPKPTVDVTKSLNSMGDEIVNAVKEAANANLSAVKPVNYIKPSTAYIKSKAMVKTTSQIVAIAASTGGTEALKQLLYKLPADIPGMVIVQHMPPVFTTNFAARLNEITPFEVREAKEGDKLLGGRALIAPGNYHMKIVRRGAEYFITLNQEARVHAVRPAADVLFESVAEYVGSNALGVILTGMGKDGAAGLKKMHECGSYNIAQDEKSCVVFGMPREAISVGAIDEVSPLEKIHSILLNQINKRKVV